MAILVQGRDTMSSDEKTVSWFSAGVSSAVATKLALNKYGDIKIIYTHIDDQHPDTLRFLKDCEKWFNAEVEILKSELKTVNNACRKASFINSPHGASCSRLLKKRVRKEWEIENGENNIYIWGMDFSEKEKNRAKRLVEVMPDNKHIFPLIDAQLTKQDAHGMIEKAGIKRPVMYDMGYPNNNCIGCLKGGMGYWNKIRNDFPDVFQNRIELEEIIGGRIFKEFDLKDLPENVGRLQPIIVPDCGLFCGEI
jgi:3'-phosphoadenosine 5'-phosphosulfate sulfotransferase (PAPS reductase)/FAD synthetase